MKRTACYNVTAMELSFLTSQKQNETLAILVDIGSASVGAALVKIKKGHTPQIVASVREDISFQEALSSQRFLAAMTRALDKALKSLEINTALQPQKSAYLPNAFTQQVFCTLSSPWFILKSRNINVSHANEFEINEHTLDDFINADIEGLKEELGKTLPQKDIRVIEKKIIQMKLNGYEIKNPYKQRTTQLGMSFVVALSSNKVIEVVEHKIKHFFPTRDVHFGVFPVAVFSAIRDIFPSEKNFLFLDITGEATNISRIENDLLIGSISFPYGKNFFIREISAQLRTVHEEASTLFSMFLRGELEGKRRTQIEKIVEQSSAEWLTRFEKAGATLASANGYLPPKIFFTTDADIMPLFSGIVSKAKSAHLEPANFDVQYLDQLIVSKFVSFEAGVTRDPFIIVEALFAEKIIQQHP